jgi:hypothetical protein
MIKIEANFTSLDRISLVDAYDEIGVYVLWSGKANARPSYIGEGNVLSRFSDHMSKSWAARPIAGCMAFLKSGSHAKVHGELVEAALLMVADKVDRFPPNNKHPGKGGSAITKLLRRADHDVGTIRIVVSGQDPLLEPERPPMRRDKWIVLNRDRDDRWHVDSSGWNRRATW